MHKLPITQANRLDPMAGVGGAGHVATSGELELLAYLPRDPVIFDVGANAGQYLQACREARPDANVYCIEPNPTYTAVLAQKGALEVIPMALSYRTGEATLSWPDGHTGLASLTPRRLEHFGLTVNRIITVATAALDDICSRRHIDHIDLLKLDVEGHELDVLKGSNRMLSARRIKLVQFEFGGCNIDTRTFLQDYYYWFKCYGMRIAKIVPRPAPQAPIHPLLEIEPYSEVFEQFRTTNFVAYHPENARYIGAAA